MKSGVVTRRAGPSIRSHDPSSPESIGLRTEFAKNHPDCVSGAAYEAGREAKRLGKPLTDCPWIESAPEATEWRNGWYGLESKYRDQTARQAVDQATVRRAA